MTKARRITNVVLAVLVFAAVTFSLFMIARGADHDCIGENCPVCAVIALCRNTLKYLGGALTAAAVLLACLRSAQYSVPSFRAGYSSQTPISLKVKLLN